MGLCLLFGRQCMALLAFPYLRISALLAWAVYGVNCCEVCSLGCPLWLVLLFMSLFVLHLLVGWGGLVTGLWPYLRLLCVGLFWGLGALFCHLSLWLHPLLMFSRLGFLPWAFVRTWVGGYGPACVPAFFWGNLLPLSWFSLGGSCSLVVQDPGVFWNLSLGSFLSLPVFADGLGWLRLILGCPPSVAWQWRLFPWFLSGTCRLALVGLRCLWIPWSCGVPGHPDGVTCLRSGLCSSSVRDRDVCFLSFCWV